jgi:hypothetical protein
MGDALNTYLSQQRAMSERLRNLPVGGTIVDSHGVVEIDNSNNAPNDAVSEASRGIDDHDMAMFKGQIKDWIELDNTIRRLQLAIKQRRAAKKDIERDIMEFMSKYNIEDLNTQDAVLRYSQREIKTTITGKTIKQRLLEFFRDAPERAEELLHFVFEEGRTTQQKTTLRRLK